MQDTSFDIKILDLHWIENGDEREDLCAHGSAYVRIGDRVIADKKDDDSWTLSAGALYLMRTVDKDYKENDFGNQLIPHCGFFLIGNDEEDFVTITGCPHGFDWTIIHEASNVRHIADTGEQAIIPLNDYKNLIFAFADQVETFYRHSKPKKLPADEFDLKGYRSFWNEWKALRSK